MKKIIKILLCITLSLFVFNLNQINAYAASGSYSISSNSSVTTGNTFKVTFTINAKKLFYWQAYVTYDTSKLTLVSGSTTIQGEDSTDGKTSNISKTLTFKAKKAGSAWVKISKGDADYNINWDGNNLSYSTASKTITIKDPVQKVYSKNNYLKSLSINGYDISPKFNKDTLEYSVELPANTEKITIKASSEDNEASISGTGEKTLTEGTNKLKIKVTAENGNERTYTINATVKELDPINVKVNQIDYTVIRKAKQLPKTNAICTETTSKINDEEIPSLKCESLNYILVGLKNENDTFLFIYDEEKNTYTKYTELNTESKTIIILDEEFEIPNGYKETTETINDTQIKVYKNDESSDYSIFYGQNLITGEKSIYKYDKLENTIQRFEKPKECKNDLISSISNNNKIMYSTVGIATLLIFTYIVILINLTKKNKKPKIIKL